MKISKYDWLHALACGGAILILFGAVFYIAPVDPDMAWLSELAKSIPLKIYFSIGLAFIIPSMVIHNILCRRDQRRQNG